jgi:molecular chaperone HscB
VDPFDLLGVEARFDLDMKALAERHRTLSGTLHPDRYVGRPASERRMALDKAIAVNAAWRALRDPVRRAESLFAHRGVEMGELAEPKPSPALLMEMMDVRESLAEARVSKDLDAIGKINDDMRKREGSVSDQLESGFVSAGDDADALSELVPLLGELRYVRRFFEELEAIEEQLME